MSNPQGHRQTQHQSLDQTVETVKAEGDTMESYFECITACSLDDGECVTQCVEILREAP